MEQTLAIGQDDFREIRKQNKYYIDKTLLIRDFIQYDNKVALITRPRRFGKTLNMTMLKEFFDITKESRKIFDGLAIMKTEYAKQINTKPVIYLTFKNCSGATFADLKDALAREMLREYVRFANEFAGKFDKTDLIYFAFEQTFNTLKKVLEARPAGKETMSQVDTGLLKNSLTTIIQVVNTFYNQPPILLIDEYDQPLISAHNKNFRKEFSEDLYADFLGSALKGNEHLGQNILTGIQRIAKESIFSKLNNFVVYSVTDREYATYFGLTEAETTQALHLVGLVRTDEVKRYYDGYLIGGIALYNPWSIITYLAKQKLEPYWLNSSTNGLIREAIANADSHFRENFDELILDGEVEVSVNLEASFMELATTQTLWGLLINSGYLTITKEYRSNFKRVRIPNEEVKEEFRTIVASYAKLNVDYLNEMFNALIDGRMEQFLKVYQRLVYKYVSSHDIRANNKQTSSKHFENSYHMLFLGMAISVSGMYEITSNLEAGNGRGDTIMTSLQPELRPHIIIEFKEGEHVEKLKHVALNQILEKQYFAKLAGEILCVGLAHNMKICELVHQVVTVDEFGVLGK